MSFYINSLILKVASRCNLNCTYCYMYNKGDLSYLRQPKFMTEEVMTAIVDKSHLHAIKHNMRWFNFIFHGGEPLLFGIERMKRFIDLASLRFDESDIKLNFTIQTNGILLTEEWCKFIGEHNIGLGISLDGPKAINDLTRIDHKGEGSYEDIIKGIGVALHSKYLSRPPGILCVINPNYSAAEILSHLVEIGIKSADFLFPDNNYVDKPSVPQSGKFRESVTPYGDWMIDLYKAWKNVEEDKRPVIKTFQDIFSKFLGATIDCDTMGNDYNRALVIETDGGIEAVDSLKICGNNFTKENANIKNDEIDVALNLPLARLYFESHKSLCSTCSSCDINELCGGGFIAHRYSDVNQFNNPSVYCRDYCRFLSHIQNDLMKYIPREVAASANLKRIRYNSLIKKMDHELSKY